MALLYQGMLGGFLASFLLVVLLLPGVVFMVFALQKWRKDASRFRWLHLIYLLLFSLFIEWLGVIAAYWFIFELHFEHLPKVLVNPVFMWILMLFFAFLHDRFFALKAEKDQGEKGPIWFEITSERRRRRLDLDKLRYIESRNEQCFFYLEQETLPSRERISQLSERLPDSFLRIHRSYIINPALATAIAKSGVHFGSKELPVSRSYKERVEAYMDEKNEPQTE